MFGFKHVNHNLKCLTICPNMQIASMQHPSPYQLIRYGMYMASQIGITNSKNIMLIQH